MRATVGPPTCVHEIVVRPPTNTVGSYVPLMFMVTAVDLLPVRGSTTKVSLLGASITGGSFSFWNTWVVVRVVGYPCRVTLAVRE